jgi:hypothetical protein
MSEAILPSPSGSQPDWLRVVQHKVETLRYGVVQLVVHDGRVTQIERTEKTRLYSPAANSADSAAL